MKYSTVEDVIASCPHPVLPTVQGESDYQTIHATRKFLQANSRAIDTHLDGGTLGHLGLIVLDTAYAMIAPTTAADPTLWTRPQAPRRDPANTDRTADKISAARHIWEADVQTYGTCTSMQQALKKQIISVFLADIFGHLERQHGGLHQYLIKIHVGSPVRDLRQHHCGRPGDHFRTHASGLGSSTAS
jgi:hypothetical protein